MTIRLIKKEDNAQVAQIIRTVMTEYGASGEGFSIHDSEVDTMFENYQTRASYYVVEDNVDNKNKILGGCGIAQLIGAEQTICELKKMYFLKEIRSKGLGQKLFDLCIKDAKKYGFEKCYLETLTSMKEAEKFYLRNGFSKLEKAMGNTGHYKCNKFYIKDL